MIDLFLALFLFSCGGRIYTSPHLHVGVRPAFEYPNGYALTVQISTDRLP